MENNFRTTDIVFNRIKENLYSFDAAGLIDEGKFYTDVKYIITLLGIKWFKNCDEILEVKNYNTLLPEDFTLLDSAYKCDRTAYSNVPLADGVVFSELSFDHYPETQIPDTHIPNECPNCPDYWNQQKCKIFNKHEELHIQRNNVITKYTRPILMRPGNVSTKRNCCTKTCMNIFSSSDITFTIQNKRFYTNFCDGHVYITYSGFPIDEETGLPLIPDNPIVEKCIEDYIMYNCIKYMWLNGDGDVAQKIALFKQEYETSLGKALFEAKLPSFATMVNSVRLTRKNLNVYQLDNNYMDNTNY